MPAKIEITRLSVNDKRIDFLGCPSELLEDELPTLRGCLRFAMLIREHALANEQEKAVRDIAREVYKKVASLYIRANRKLVPPVIMDEEVTVQKFVRKWEDIETILRKQKHSNKVEARITPELDKLFDIMYCKCPIECVLVVTDELSKCSHSKLMCCDNERTCTLEIAPISW